MASGVKVAKEVKDVYDDMKVNKKDDTADQRLRIVILHINNDHIEVEKIIKQEDLKDKGNTYKHLQSLMVDTQCRYILYDCHYHTKLSKKEELVCLMWSPDNAKIKEKMKYASSRSSLKAVIKEKHEYEFHSQEEIEPKEFADKLTQVSKENITLLEGLDVSGF